MAPLLRVPGRSMLLATWAMPGAAAAQLDHVSRSVAESRRATANRVETGAVEIVPRGSGIVQHHPPALHGSSRPRTLPVMPGRPLRNPSGRGSASLSRARRAVPTPELPRRTRTIR